MGNVVKLFCDRLAKKKYLVVVFGWSKEDEWMVNVKFGKDLMDVKGFCECVDEENGKVSEMSFKVL